MAGLGIQWTVLPTVVVAVAAVMGMMISPTFAQGLDTNTCKSDQDCQATPNSHCLKGSNGDKHCQCLSSHNNQSDECVANTLGDVCTRHIDCSDVISNAYCPKKAGVCRCRSGYRNQGDSECQALAVGDSCQWNRQCKEVIKNSVCKRSPGGQRVCTCNKGYHVQSNGNETTCELTVLGSNCSSSSDCEVIGKHVACLSGVCECKFGFSSDNGTSSCTPIVLNSACARPKDCGHISHGVCETGESKCVCDAGYREDKNEARCVKTLYNTACDFDHHCPAPNSSCDFLTGFCKCKYPFEPTKDRSSCFFRYLENTCVQDDDCSKFVPNSECTNQQCSCKTNYLPSEDLALCILPIIDHTNCTNDNILCEQLVNNSYCRNDGVCACQLGYDVTNDFNTCKEKNLQDSCKSNEECLATNPFTECAGEPEICQCTLGYVIMTSDQPEVKSICRRRVLGRHECQSEGDCSAAVENSSCVPCRIIGETHFCVDACQGMDTAFCTVKTCVCQLGFYQVGGGTRCQKRRLRDDCTDDPECSAAMDNAVCHSSGRCYCQSGFKPVGNDTCQKRLLDDHCYENKECYDSIPNSYCHVTSVNIPDNINNMYGACVCKSGHTPINGSICRKRRVGDKTCTKDLDCSDAVSDSICSSGMCICRPGFIPGINLHSCSERTLHGPYCTTTDDCNAVMPHTKCLQNQCVCETGYRDVNNTECVKFKLGDTGCRGDSDCADAVINSACSGIDQICACVTGYHPDVAANETCVARNISGHVCHKDEDCAHSVANSHCKDDQCACVSGFYHMDNGTQCVKRTLGDSCTQVPDCLDVIRNSTCRKDICTCDEGFDPDENYTHCFPRPKYIASACISDAQCLAIDFSSSCVASQDDVIRRCVCPDGMFVSDTRQECVKLPVKMGERCRLSSHCAQSVVHSMCPRKTKLCACQNGFFEDEDGNVCTPVPIQMEDRCLQNSHCTQLLSPDAVCDKDNNTCICRYGYTQNSSTECTERTQIQTYKRYPTPRPPVECQGLCENQNNSICVEMVETSTFHCQCELRFAAAYNQRDCIPVQTYLYRVRLIQEAGTYDYQPLPYKAQYKSSQLLAFQRFAQRITRNGLMDMMRGISLGIGHRYVSSKVLTLKPLKDESGNKSSHGVEADILLNFKATAKYYGATPSRRIDNVIRKQLANSGRELGTSRLKVSHPLTRSSSVKDFDECEHTDDNDCSPEALCINTLGSFMCVCRSDYVDLSMVQDKRKGRICKIPDTTVSDSVLCSSDGCETSWEFVALVLTLFLLVIMSFIVYEIVQRKQNFNARKLYERLGQTRIRRLQLNTASLRKFQERRKKKKRKMSKKKKKKDKKKGGKGKGSGTEESDVDKASPSPTDLDTEEAAPSTSEIIHSPSVPIVDVLGPDQTDPEVGVSTSDFNDDSVTVFMDD